MFELQLNWKVLTLELDNWNFFIHMPLLGLDIFPMGHSHQTLPSRDLDS